MLGHPVKADVLDVLRNVKTYNLGYIIVSMIYRPVKFEFDWTKSFLS